MPPIEIERLEQACMAIAHAIETGHSYGLLQEIRKILGYIEH